MPLTLVYETAGRLEVAHIAPGCLAEDVASSIVPSDVQWRVLDETALPTDPTYREAWTANFDAEPCVVTVDPVKAAAVDRKLAEEEIESWFAGEIAEGFATEDGWKLGLSYNDVTLLTGNYVLAKEAAVLGLPIPPIMDRNGVVHEFESIEELTAIMLAYGQHRAALSAEYAARKAALPPE